ncbi:glycogen synthase GlgA [Rubinisphaera margarita]|uniref:glycogen synthase GlgA n=1 Tax=Rubinisphaera margarita TaxID=2909586 RepID=UPI001EE948F7|nr:glycogen synthase GlgA [Rubinisphaera margarita]MCG6158454.1 glycogen synthase GlgA [Rubinisphaera margarita]
MKILMTASEAVPFAKTGGLADVATALSRALEQDGHDITLVMPHYPQLLPHGSRQRFQIEPIGDEFTVPVGPRKSSGSFLKARLPDSNIQVILVDQPDYFDRPSPYVYENIPYEDNCERFVFFSRAIVAAIKQFGPFDIVHANDWQTGLLPALIDIEARKHSPEIRRIGTVFTIHNLAFQGRFWHWDMVLTGLDWKYFNWKQMEFFGDLNLLKTGIVFADMVTTVSPTYAREIQTPDFGWGLDPALSGRGNSLVGILNGVDTEVWHPEVDRFIKVNYTADDVAEKKPICKADLQKAVGLQQKPDVPIIAMISRMSQQKGFDLLQKAGDRLLSNDAQFVFLGTGERPFEQFVKELAQTHPGRVASMIRFDEELAHKIEAGSDLFLMPSEFEPCGLNQMYSMLYGTVPLVHAVGGLADSVVPMTGDTLREGTATGFSFQRYSCEAFLEAFEAALRTYRDKETWLELQKNGMLQDLSWSNSARNYVQVYQRALEKHTPEV